MANVIKPFNNIHFLTEEQYSQETISENDIYAVKMESITPGEIVLAAFQNGIEIPLTAEQKAAAKVWFGIADTIPVKSDDPTITELNVFDAELLTIGFKTVTIDGETFTVLVKGGDS